MIRVGNSTPYNQSVYAQRLQSLPPDRALQQKLTSLIRETMANHNLSSMEELTDRHFRDILERLHLDDNNKFRGRLLQVGIPYVSRFSFFSNQRATGKVKALMERLSVQTCGLQPRLSGTPRPPARFEPPAGSSSATPRPGYSVDGAAVPAPQPAQGVASAAVPAAPASQPEVKLSSAAPGGTAPAQQQVNPPAAATGLHPAPQPAQGVASAAVPAAPASQPELKLSAPAPGGTTHAEQQVNQSSAATGPDLKHNFTFEQIDGWLFDQKQMPGLPPSKLTQREQEKYAPKTTFESVPSVGKGAYTSRIAIHSGSLTDLRAQAGHTAAIGDSNNGDLLTGCGYAVAKAVVNATGAGLQQELYNKFGVPGVMKTTEYGQTHYADTEGRGFSLTCGSYDMKKTHNIDKVELMTVPMDSRDGVKNMYKEAFTHSKDKDYIAMPMAGMTHPVLNGDSKLSAEIALEAFKEFVDENPDSRLEVVFAIFNNAEAEGHYREKAASLEDKAPANASGPAPGLASGAGPQPLSSNSESSPGESHSIQQTAAAQAPSAAATAPATSSNISVRRGNITDYIPSANCVVIPTDPNISGGGAVEAALRNMRIPGYEAKCQGLRDKGGCPVGEARSVPVGVGMGKDVNVVFTASPQWTGLDPGGDEAELAACYKNTIKLVDGMAGQPWTIPIPAIGTGASSFPSERAAQIAVKAVDEALGTCKHRHQVVFVPFTEKDAAAYDSALEQHGLG